MIQLIMFLRKRTADILLYLEECYPLVQTPNRFRYIYGPKLVIADEASPLDCFLSTEAPGATVSSRPPRHQPLRLHPCPPGVVCVYRALMLWSADGRITSITAHLWPVIILN